MCTTNAEQLGLVSKEIVEKMFDELLPWDKEEFFKEHMIEAEIEAEESEEDYYDTCYEFVRDHDSSDILSEMDEREILDYLRDYSYSSIYDIIEFFMRYGKSYKEGYTKEELLEVIEKVAHKLV